MEPACIRHTELPGTSRLFADFTYHFDRVARFYRHDPHNPASLIAAARELDYPEERRQAIVRNLAAQNGQSESLSRLAQPGTVAVVTGQQVGLFSGPAYTIYKALTAARLASELTARGIQAVPVFWLATEDHDFDEVNHAWVFDASRTPVQVRVDGRVDSNGRQRPVGGITLDRPPVNELTRSLDGFPHAEELAAVVKEAYPSGVTMGAGFRALLAKLLGRLGILFLDPLDPAVREIGAPLVAEALSAAPELKARLLQRNRDLADAGYHAQVHLEEKTSLFFLLEKGERIPLRRKDSEFSELRDRAAEVSPNALLRPVMQDYLLPTAAYIGGPAELAYLAQAQVLYDRLLGRMPVAIARTGFTLLDSRATKLLDRYKLRSRSLTLWCRIRSSAPLRIRPRSSSAAWTACARSWRVSTIHSWPLLTRAGRRLFTNFKKPAARPPAKSCAATSAPPRTPTTSPVSCIRTATCRNASIRSFLFSRSMASTWWTGCTNRSSSIVDHRVITV